MILPISSLVNEVVERSIFGLLKESVRSLLVFSTKCALLSKKVVEDLNLLFKTSNLMVCMINW